MQTIKVDRMTHECLGQLQAARDNKNKASKAEKEIKNSLVRFCPQVESDEIAMMFNGQVVATQTESFRSGIDLEKLAKEFPKAFAACQVQNRVLTLKVTI
jgi:hypothetical protein